MTLVEFDKLVQIMKNHYLYSEDFIKDLRSQLENADAIRETQEYDNENMTANCDKLIDNERYHLTELLAVERDDIIRALAQRCIDPEHHRFNNTSHRDCRNCRFSKVVGYSDVVCCDSYKIDWLNQKIEED